MNFFFEKSAKAIPLAFSQLSPPMYISTCVNKDVGKQSPSLHSTSTKPRMAETLAELTARIVTLLLSCGRCLMTTLPDTFTGILQQLLPVT